MSEATGDRIHPATPNRRRQARAEGHVARSQDLASAAVLLATFGTLLYFGGGVARYLIDTMREQLGASAWLSIEAGDLTHLWNSTLLAIAVVLLPLLGLTMGWAILSSLMQVGFLMLPEQVAPDLGRLNPLRGLGRIFSLTGVSRLGFALLKVAAVGGVAFYCIYGQREAIVGAASLDALALGRFVAEIVLLTSLKIGGVLLAFGLCDFGMQWWQRERDLRMTTQEIREDAEASQGSTQAIARRRASERRGKRAE